MDTRGAEASGGYYYPYEEEPERSEDLPPAGLCRAGKVHLSSSTCDTGAYANRLLKHSVDYADLVMERTPAVLQMARILQIEAAHKYATIKQ